MKEIHSPFKLLSRFDWKDESPWLPQRQKDTRSELAGGKFQDTINPHMSGGQVDPIATHVDVDSTQSTSSSRTTQKWQRGVKLLLMSAKGHRIIEMGLRTLRDTSARSLKSHSLQWSEVTENIIPGNMSQGSGELHLQTSILNDSQDSFRHFKTVLLL